MQAVCRRTNHYEKEYKKVLQVSTHKTNAHKADLPTRLCYSTQPAILSSFVNKRWHNSGLGCSHLKARLLITNMHNAHELTHI